MTFNASEHVLTGGAGNRIKARSRFVINPTVGALEVPADLRFKVRKTLAGQVRSPTFRF